MNSRKMVSFFFLSVKTSKIIGRTIEAINLPKGTTLGAIVREEAVIIPKADTIIQSGDHIILFVSDKKNMAAVEKLFLVSPGFF